MKIQIKSAITTFSNRLIFFFIQESGPNVESAKKTETAKEKSDVTTIAGREKIYQDAQKLIDAMNQKALELKAANDQKAKEYETKANSLQRALKAAKEATAEDSRIGLIEQSDYSSRVASTELVRRIDLILNPPKTSGSQITAEDMAALAAENARTTAALGVNSPAIASTDKPATTPAVSAEKASTEAPKEVRDAAKKYAAETHLNGVQQFTDSNGVVWEAKIGNNTGDNPNTVIVIRRKSLPTVNISA